MSEIHSEQKRARFFLKWGSIALGWIVLYLLAFTFLIDKRPFVEWTLIKSDSQTHAAQAQLVKMPDGQVFLINAGKAAGSLLLYLKKQKIKDIDQLILSSFGPDSISALKDMLGSGIRIKEVKTNPLSLETADWLAIKEIFLKKGISLQSLSLESFLFSQSQTQLKVMALAKDSLILRLIHGKNSLAAGLGDSSAIGGGIRSLGCSQLKTEVLVDYTQPQTQEPYLDWVGCLNPEHNLSLEPGTFKILLKGDSFKWKRGR
ncbi:MAG: hypothetical protein ACKOA8_03640 [Deltaproteobacteria bacterium]